MPGLGVGIHMPLMGVVGFIRMKPKGLLSLPETPTLNTTRKTPLTTAQRRRRGEVLAAAKGTPARNSGNARSSDDRYLVVHYNFDRQSLAPARMLTAFLRTLAFCAEHNDDELFGAGMAAFSADGFVRLRMDGVSQAGQGPGAAGQLSWKQARLALRTMWSQVVMGFEGRWEAFSFIVEYRGVRIGQGWIG